MNYMINRLDNFKLVNRSYEFIPKKVKREFNIEGRLLGTGSQFIVSNRDQMILIKKSMLEEQIGKLEYDALMRKPMFVFFLASNKNDFGKTKKELDEIYGSISINLNNFAQAFSIGCWFIKDSCIASNNMYWCNMFTNYRSCLKRDMPVTLSNGKTCEVNLDNIEITEAIERMYEILKYLSPHESNMGKINCNISNGTLAWEIDNAISTEGRSFARALVILQEARRTGYLSTKIDKYCSVLECLYAIKENHKKNIANITAAYIGKDDSEKEDIISDMRDAYSIRSDGSHGDSLKYLKKNNKSDLMELSYKIDGYVRKVFRKILKEPTLNYDKSPEKKAKARAYFMEKAKAIYPNDYNKI